MKRLIILLSSIVLIAVLVSTAAAQAIPGLDVLLDPAQAHANDLVYASVFVRGGVNIAGADVELTTDDPCLRFEGLEPGSYLPTEGETGYTVYRVASENSARLAANVLGRQNVASGDGVFFRVPIRVLCEDSDISVTVAQAHLVNDQLQEFKMSDGLLNVTHATLAIGDSTDDRTMVDNTHTESVAEVPAEQVASNGIDLKTIVLIAGGLLGLGFAFILLTQFRRFRREEA